MSRFERREGLLKPAGDGGVIRAKLMDRAIQELPLEGCELVRDPVMGRAYFQAPEGKAFWISGDSLEVYRNIPYGYGGFTSRSDAESPLADDPNTLNDFSHFEPDKVPEHLATRLSVSVGGRPLGIAPPNTEQWTDLPDRTNSDTKVEVMLLDPPQAWTEPYLACFYWATNGAELARRHPALISIPLSVVGVRQTYIAGSIGECRVELVDLEPRQSEIDDQVARTPDGRVLQLAIKNEKGNTPTLDLRLGDITAAEKDAYDRSRHIQPDSLACLPEAERLRIYWASRRRIVGWAGHFDPFEDDPLRDFEFVEKDPDTGRVDSIEQLIAKIKREIELTLTHPNELEDLADKMTTDPATYTSWAEAYIEPIAADQPLASAVLRYCSPDWEVEAGQRRYSVPFGFYKFPHQLETVSRDLGKKGLTEAVLEYTGPNWRRDDHLNHRATEIPRKYRPPEDYDNDEI